MKRITLSLILMSLFTGLVWSEEPSFAQHESIDLVKAAHGATVLLIGDDHTQKGIKVFLEAQLDILKSEGFSCLAFEMLPVDFQNDLDSWSPSAQQRIYDHLSTAWADKGTGIPDSLFAVLQKAKGIGMHVIALDPSNASQMSRVAVNPHWLTCIKDCLAGRCRMIVFAGRSHVDPVPGSLTTLLGKDGIATSVIEFSGLEEERSAQLDLRTAQLLNRPAHPTTVMTLLAAKLGAHENFMVPGESVGLPCPGSWIISLSHNQIVSPIRLAHR